MQQIYLYVNLKYKFEQTPSNQNGKALEVTTAGLFPKKGKGNVVEILYTH